MKKKLENRRNDRLIVSPIRKFPRGGGGNFCLAPIFEHGHCRAVGHSSWNESRDTIVSTGRNKSSFRSVRPRVVPFPRISPILARSNVRALIVHWFLSKEKRDRGGGKKREEKKKRRKKEKKDKDLCSLDNCSLVRNSLKNRRAVGVMYDAKKLLFKATM